MTRKNSKGMKNLPIKKNAGELFNYALQLKCVAKNGEEREAILLFNSKDDWFGRLTLPRCGNFIACDMIDASLRNIVKRDDTISTFKFEVFDLVKRKELSFIKFEWVDREIVGREANSMMALNDAYNPHYEKYKF